MPSAPCLLMGSRCAVPGICPGARHRRQNERNDQEESEGHFLVPGGFQATRQGRAARTQAAGPAPGSLSAPGPSSAGGGVLVCRQRHTLDSD